MLHRGVVVSAAVAYLLVLAVMVWPGSAPQAAQAQAGEPAASSTAAVPVSSAALPLRGGAVQIQRVDWIDKYKQSIDRIAEVGGDTVSLVVDTRQENARSTRIYLDMRKTPTVEQLSELIQHAKRKGLRVVLMPIVLLDDPGDDWRGTLKPESWDKWFDSYREIMNHFSWVAQANGVDVLVVGSELVSSEDKLDEWRQTIREIRAVFKGMLTYSSNWDHYTSVHFWDQLDLIGMNSYWKFGDKGKNSSPSVEQIVERWEEIQSDGLLPFVRKAGKPLLFLEIGWFSQANVAYEPWDYTKVDEPIDLELQRKLYEAFFQAWHGHPLLGGFMVWEWPPDDSGPDNRGYTPAGKPAEKVLREWLAKPKWEVKVGRG